MTLFSQSIITSHQIAAALLFFLLLLLGSRRYLIVRDSFLCEYGLLMVDFFLVAEQHVISIFIFLALFLDIIQFFARHELRLFFEFVGQEKVPKRVAFMACEECCQF